MRDLENTYKDPSIVVDVHFLIPSMQDVVPEPMNLWGIHLNFVYILVSIVNCSAKSKGKEKSQHVVALPSGHPFFCQGLIVIVP